MKTGVLKRYGEEGNMDGKAVEQTLATDRSAKPVFPLPGIFSLRMRSELPTQPQWTGEKLERAHFFPQR
jgi:hypothetical protein